MTTAATVSVRIPPPLRALTAGRAEVEARGRTVGEALADLDRSHRGVAERILTADGDAVRGFVDVLVDDRDIRRLDGLSSSLADAAVVSIVPAAGRRTGAVDTTKVARLASRIERQGRERR